MFTKIENQEVMVQNSSGYKVLPLYKRNSDNRLFAKNGQYYIAILPNNCTSNIKIRWQEISIPLVTQNGYYVYTETSV